MSETTSPLDLPPTHSDQPPSPPVDPQLLNTPTPTSLNPDVLTLGSYLNTFRLPIPKFSQPHDPKSQPRTYHRTRRLLHSLVHPLSIDKPTPSTPSWVHDRLDQLDLTQVPTWPWPQSLRLTGGRFAADSAALLVRRFFEEGTEERVPRHTHCHTDPYLGGASSVCSLVNHTNLPSSHATEIHHFVQIDRGGTILSLEPRHFHLSQTNPNDPLLPVIDNMFFHLCNQGIYLDYEYAVHLEMSAPYRLTLSPRYLRDPGHNGDNIHSPSSNRMDRDRDPDWFQLLIAMGIRAAAEDEPKQRSVFETMLGDMKRQVDGMWEERVRARVSTKVAREQQTTVEYLDSPLVPRPQESSLDATVGSGTPRTTRIETMPDLTKLEIKTTKSTRLQLCITIDKPELQVAGRYWVTCLSLFDSNISGFANPFACRPTPPSPSSPSWWAHLRHKHLGIHLLEYIGTGHQSDAYRVSISRPDLFGGLTTAVLKICVVDDLHEICKRSLYRAERDIHNERAMYNRLKSLQGVCVSRILGHFEGDVFCSDPTYSRYLNAMLMEDGGPMVAPEGCGLDEKTKLEILECYQKIHQLGIRHRSLRKSHIRRAADGTIRLIDFDHASVEDKIELAKEMDEVERMVENW